MLKAVLISTFILSVLLLGASCRSEPGVNAPKETAAPDAEYLKNAGAEWDKFYNAGDVANLSALYAENVVSMPYNAPTINGKKAWRDDLESFLAQNPGAK